MVTIPDEIRLSIENELKAFDLKPADFLAAFKYVLEDYLNVPTRPIFDRNAKYDLAASLYHCTICLKYNFKVSDLGIFQINHKDLVNNPELHRFCLDTVESFFIHEGSTGETNENLIEELMQQETPTIPDELKGNRILSVDFI